MNVFVPDAAKVRIFKEKSTGRIMRVTTNVIPNLPVEVVEVADGETLNSAEERTAGTLPFGCKVN